MMTSLDPIQDVVVILPSRQQAYLITTENACDCGVSSPADDMNVEWTQGDSGGPMSCFKNEIWYQAGLTSWGIATCNGIPPVYTRISSYWSWIQLEMMLNAPTTSDDSYDQY